MGVCRHRSWSSYDYPPSPLPNPDPNNFKIIQSVETNGNLALYIHYPDCTNYEGRKILVFRGASLKDIMAQRCLDPHFSANEDLRSPFARFEPTNHGWEAALRLLRN